MRKLHFFLHFLSINWGKSRISISVSWFSIKGEKQKLKKSNFEFSKKSVDKNEIVRYNYL